MHHRSPALALLAGLSACSAQGLTGQDVCDQVPISVSQRVYACSGDADLANASGEMFSDAECIVADDDVEDGTWGRPTIECIAALDEVDCALALEHADDLDWWLGAIAACGPILGSEGEAPGDTGAAGVPR